MNKNFIACVAVLAAATAHGLTINQKVYFAYSEGPSGLVALSKEPCPITKYVKDGMKRARYHQLRELPPRVLDQEGSDVCWTYDKEYGAVKICPITTDGSNELYGCYPADKRRFFYTNELRQTVKF